MPPAPRYEGFVFPQAAGSISNLNGCRSEMESLPRKSDMIGRCLNDENRDRVSLAAFELGANPAQGLFAHFNLGVDYTFALRWLSTRGGATGRGACQQERGHNPSLCRLRSASGAACVFPARGRKGPKLRSAR